MKGFIHQLHEKAHILLLDFKWKWGDLTSRPPAQPTSNTVHSATVLAQKPTDIDEEYTKRNIVCDTTTGMETRLGKNKMRHQIATSCQGSQHHPQTLFKHQDWSEVAPGTTWRCKWILFEGYFPFLIKLCTARKRFLYQEVAAPDFTYLKEEHFVEVFSESAEIFALACSGGNALLLKSKLGWWFAAPMSSSWHDQPFHMDVPTLCYRISVWST